MNNTDVDIAAESTPTASRTILYFRFRFDVGTVLQQVEYGLLQTYLNQHRGKDDSAEELCRDGYWAVVATSETGIGVDAIDYTADYLRSMPTVAKFSVTMTPPLPDPLPRPTTKQN